MQTPPYLRALLAIAWAATVLAACSTGEPVPGTITAAGSGQALAEPDLALLTLGFWTKDEDANLAINNSRSTLAELTEQLTALGVGSQDIDPFGLTMNTEQIFGPEGYPTDRLLYAVNQSVSVRVHDTASLGNILNTVRIVAGAPYLFSLSVTYDLSEARRAQALAEAQANALADARANAERLAQSLGVTLDTPAEARVVSQQVTASPMVQAQVTVEISFRIK